MAVGTSLAGSFTDPAAFMAAVAALPGTVTLSTVHFDDMAPGDSVSTVGGISFVPPAGLSTIVSSGFSTTSGSNYLGVDDGADEVFIASLDEWGLVFGSPVNAVGMYFISSDPLFAGDIRLVTSLETASNAGTENLILGDGGLAYFVGLVSGTAFDGVDVGYGPDVTGQFFVYNVDDITTASTAVTPAAEPSSIVLAALAAALLVRVRRARS
jgi:hypothetical protein